MTATTPIAPTRKLVTAADVGAMTLMYMRSENVKRVRLIELTLKDGVTTIGGANAQGKSSLLDSYKFALGGKAVIDMQPIHRGQQKGTITLHFGDGQNVKMKIVATLKRVGDDEFTSELRVEIPNGVPPTKIQNFLDELAGEYSFDPLAFMAMKPNEQFDALRKFCPDFDFAANDKKYDDIFKTRTEVSKDLKRERAAAESIEVSDTPPYDAIDEADLISQMRTASDTNSEIDRRLNARAALAAAIEKHKTDAEQALGVIPERVKASNKKWEDTIFGLTSQIHALEKQLANANDMQRHAAASIEDQLKKQHRDEMTLATDKQALLDGAEPLAEKVDVAALETRLNCARASNAERTRWQANVDRRGEHIQKAEAFLAEETALTDQLNGLKTAKQAAIESAKLPVPGLGFGSGFVTFNELPLAQASSAEQLKVSTGIAMAMNPKLKVILIRNGSNLDSHSKAVIADMAKEQGYRVLMEVVDESGGASVTIEDGVLKDREAAKENAA